MRGRCTVIRIRFHGRGGHGMKTASRIVGTAAFVAGYEAQDSPVYGAERRGAPVTAFARIDREPILERGMIERPDLIVVADETLLADARPIVLGGQEGAAAVIVNAESDKGLAERYGISCCVMAVDMIDITVEELGRASALSAAAAAAAVKAAGCAGESELLRGVREELEHAGVDESDIVGNERVARRVFAAVEEVVFEAAALGESAGAVLSGVDYDPPLIGSPSILAAGNAELRDTGSWRVERPEIDYDACTRCGLCFLRCPDGAIALDEEGYPLIDYDHCKGCMICYRQCPIHGIIKKRETRAW